MKTINLLLIFVHQLRVMHAPKSYDWLNFKDAVIFADCNYSKGRWVAESRRPLYSGFECKQWLSEMWACRLTQRTEFSFEGYRWQPDNCKMLEFDKSAFLRRSVSFFLVLILKGQCTLLFSKPSKQSHLLFSSLIIIAFQDAGQNNRIYRRFIRQATIPIFDVHGQWWRMEGRC